MPTPFPGMDPYLERPSIWEEIHTQLIVDMARAINRQVSPRYYVTIEHRSYMSLQWSDDSDDGELIGIPDIMVINGSSGGVNLQPNVALSVMPMLAELPMPDQVTERYLEIHDAEDSGIVITAIEILSPTNKSDREGRELYRRKRLNVLGSMTHLIEIDLLRAGQPMDMRVPHGKPTHYRIVISRSYQRPRSDLYAFSVRDPIPMIPIPLRKGEVEPILDLNHILHEIYDSLSYQRKINYQRKADPPLKKDDDLWADSVLREKGLR